MATSIVSRKRVLLVDDDSLFLSTLADQLTILSEGSWEVVTTDSATKALNLLEQSTFRLVVVDLQMPVMNGNQFLTLVRRRYPSLHKAVLAGYATEEDRAACLSNGAELCLDKPTSPLDLEAVFSALDDLVRWQPEEGFRGVLRRVGLEDVLQMECLSRHSGILEICGPAGDGEIHIQDGQIIHASAGELLGEDAFNHLLSLRGGEFQLRPFAPPPSTTIQTPWEMLLMEAARKRDESAVGTNDPIAEPIAAPPDLGAPKRAAPSPPTPPAEAPSAPQDLGPLPRIYLSQGATGTDTSPFRRKTTPSEPSPEIVFARPVPGVGLDLASATSTLGRLVCDSTGTPIPIPNPPEPEIPVTIQELMLCDGEGEILSRWQCSTPDRWIELLEFVSQKSRQLAHGLAAGQVDRLVITTPEDRTAFRVGVDYGVVARAAPGFTFPEDRRIPLPVPVRAWLKGLLPAPQVSGWGLWFPERTTLTSSFSDRHTIGVLDNGWRAVADLYNVLFAHRIPAHRIQWDFELARIYSQRRPDGLIFNLFAKRSTAPDDSLTRLLDQFAGSEFARA